ncbi:MAG: chorismate mutase, partial [Deltaproteobacteria bacterium]|nr:chorismate mutase [Deltaproteobacteria bacterium]
MKLEKIRKRIDTIDLELLGLIEERMGLALRSGKFKKEIRDPEREEQVYERARRLSLNLVLPEFGEGVLRKVIEESRRLQGEGRQLVAFQGEHGAYSEIASRRLVPDGAYVPCMEFSDVFQGVDEGTFDLGVVPVENSLEGAVTQVNDLLTETKLKVVGEVKVPLNHCLVARDGTDYRDIRVVYSHPQALAQCRGFLSRNKLEPRPYYDTAGAARMLVREQPRGAAAIASKLSAELYGLQIIKEGIDDGASNSTRFLQLSCEAFKGEGDKCSIIFATTHEAGVLYGVLRLFAEAKINLTRIASMPQRSDPDNTTFFLDFEGSERDE